MKKRVLYEPVVPHSVVADVEFYREAFLCERDIDPIRLQVIARQAHGVVCPCQVAACDREISEFHLTLPYSEVEGQFLPTYICI